MLLVHSEYESTLLWRLLSRTGVHCCSVRIPADPRATVNCCRQAQSARRAHVKKSLISCHRNLRGEAFTLIIGSTYLRIDCDLVAPPTRYRFSLISRQNISQNVLQVWWWMCDVLIWQLRLQIHLVFNIFYLIYLISIFDF